VQWGQGISVGLLRCGTSLAHHFATLKLIPALAGFAADAGGEIESSGEDQRNAASAGGRRKPGGNGAPERTSKYHHTRRRERARERQREQAGVQEQASGGDVELLQGIRQAAQDLPRPREQEHRHAKKPARAQLNTPIWQSGGHLTRSRCRDRQRSWAADTTEPQSPSTPALGAMVRKLVHGRRYAQ
jgi:hypothetical protein